MVAHRTTDREVQGSIPTGSWAFFLLSLSLLFPFSSVNQWCVLNQVPRGGATLLLFPKKNGGLAVQLEAKQA